MDKIVIAKILEELNVCNIIRKSKNLSLKYTVDPASNPAYNCIVARKIALTDIILNIIRRNNAGTFKH